MITFDWIGEVIEHILDDDWMYEPEPWYWYIQVFPNLDKIIKYVEKVLENEKQ